MSNPDRTYLTVRNILYIILISIVTIFLCPGANSHMGRLNLGFLSVAMWLVLLILCFSFKSLLDRNYFRATILSVVGVISWIIWTSLSLLSLNSSVSSWLFSFIDPISLSLMVIFIFERKWKLAFLGYILGYFFSFFPLMGSMWAILFFQLWLDSLSKEVGGSRLQQFLSRIYMYGIIMFVGRVLCFEVQLPVGSGFSSGRFSQPVEVGVIVLVMVALYYMLSKYLVGYYSRYDGKILKILSYIPGLWIVPLVAIWVKCDKGGGLTNN